MEPFLFFTAEITSTPVIVIIGILLLLYVQVMGSLQVLPVVQDAIGVISREFPLLPHMGEDVFVLHPIVLHIVTAVVKLLNRAEQVFLVMAIVQWNTYIFFMYFLAFFVQDILTAYISAPSRAVSLVLRRQGEAVAAHPPSREMYQRMVFMALANDFAQWRWTQELGLLQKDARNAMYPQAALAAAVTDLQQQVRQLQQQLTQARSPVGQRWE